MPSDEILSPARRWAMVNERLRVEAQAATDERKLAQLASLMASVDDFGWRTALAEDDDRVRALWMRLRSSGTHGR